MPKYYKALNPDGNTPEGYGHYDTSNRDWQPAIEGKLEACKNGYHLLRTEDIIEWNCPELWEVEIEGRVTEFYTQIVVSSFRFVRKLDTWNEWSQRLFACDCADRALALIDKEQIDPRNIEAVRLARLYALGEASDEELGAAWGMAWDAHRKGAVGARIAMSAAMPFAHSAVCATAKFVEVEWRTQRLQGYLDGRLPLPEGI